ncbi:MAG: ATP-binding protein [Actinobacteria bacterium]|nr:MAG: ATP-binding protein [Actinomycetota bacterium]
MSAGRLILVCGLPGTGKTTLAQRLQREMRAVRLCPDEWMAALGLDLWDSDTRVAIESMQWSVAVAVLRLHGTVVIEWGLWSRVERDHLRIAARQEGAAVELRFLDAPVDVLLERVRERAMEERLGSAAITREHLEQWDAALERPDARELALFDPPDAP